MPEHLENTSLAIAKAFLVHEQSKAVPAATQRIVRIIANLDERSIRRIKTYGNNEALFCNLDSYTITNKNGYQTIFYGILFHLKEDAIINASIVTIRTDMGREDVNRNIGAVLSNRLPSFSGDIIWNQLNGRFLLSAEITGGKLQKTKEARSDNGQRNGTRSSRLQEGCTDWYLVSTICWADGHIEQNWEFLFTTCGDCTPTDEPLTTLITDCIPEGGGGGYAYAHNTNPCKVADSLATNVEFKKRMDSLKQWSTANYETGYMSKRNIDGSFSYIKTTGTLGGGQINLSVPTPIHGYMHNHYGGLLSIFSVTDLQAMYQLLTTGKMADPATFTMSLVTESGTTYMLQIEDIAKFRAFGNLWLYTDANAAVFNQYIYTNTYHIETSNSNENNLRGFLWMLQHYDMGLKFFQGNINTFGEWHPKGYDLLSSTIINTPCN